jgi:thymidine phosphorylase
VGNALEVAEAVDTLQGRGPDDLVQLTLDLAAKVATAPRAQLAGWLSDGHAWRRFIALVEAQDGDATSLEKLAATHAAPIIHPLPAPHSGVIKRIDAETIGRAALFLGAGRARAGDSVDFAVGFSQIKKVGERIEPNEPLLYVHARTDHALVSVLPLLEGGIEIG